MDISEFLSTQQFTLVHDPYRSAPKVGLQKHEKAKMLEYCSLPSSYSALPANATAYLTSTRASGVGLQLRNHKLSGKRLARYSQGHITPRTVSQHKQTGTPSKKRCPWFLRMRVNFVQNHKPSLPRVPFRQNSSTCGFTSE